MKTIIANILWLAIVVTGCGMDSFFDSPKSAVAIFSAFLAAILCCVVLAIADDK